MPARRISLTRPASAIASQSKPRLTDWSREQLRQFLVTTGEPEYRADQVLGWVYGKRVTAFDDMTNLSRELRARLQARVELRTLTLVREQGSRDTTRKFLFRLTDGRYLESVLIPASPALYGSRSDRHTLCVSSQVGCAYGCKFCASGLKGFTRNLTPGEIVEQIFQAEAISGKKINNIVFMGMGEPLANERNLLRAIEIINASWGIGIGARHMTISTSGLVPQIKKLADHPLQIRLAVSLHGASDSVREKIMPINKRYPLAKLFEALSHYRQRKKQKITFEYILIKGINDSLEQARLLAKHARDLQAKVNVIPYNHVEGLSWERPDEGRQQAFLDALEGAQIHVNLRREKGHDIDAACGQLRLKEEGQL